MEPDYLSTAAVAYPAHAETFAAFGESYAAKTWQQLGTQLRTLAADAAAAPLLAGVYADFVVHLSAKLNPLHISAFAIAVSEATAVAAGTDVGDAISFLESVLLNEDVAKSKQAAMLVQLAIVTHKLATTTTDVDALREEMQECNTRLIAVRKSIDSFVGVLDTSVHSHYFLTAARYHKHVGPPQQYYTNAQLYLTYTPLADIAAEKQVPLAAEIGLAALLGR
jgi:hypothetical protein